MHRFLHTSYINFLILNIRYLFDIRVFKVSLCPDATQKYLKIYTVSACLKSPNNLNKWLAVRIKGGDGTGRDIGSPVPDRTEPHFSQDSTVHGFPVGFLGMDRLLRDVPHSVP